MVSSTLVASVRLATLLLSKSWFEVFRSSFDVNPVHALARINFAKLKASNLSEKIKRNDSSRRIKALFELNKVFLVFFNLLLVFNTILFQVDGNRVCCCWCKWSSTARYKRLEGFNVQAQFKPTASRHILDFIPVLFRIMASRSIPVLKFISWGVTHWKPIVVGGSRSLLLVLLLTSCSLVTSHCVVVTSFLVASSLVVITLLTASAVVVIRVVHASIVSWFGALRNKVVLLLVTTLVVVHLGLSLIIVHLVSSSILVVLLVTHVVLMVTTAKLLLLAVLVVILVESILLLILLVISSISSSVRIIISSISSLIVVIWRWGHLLSIWKLIVISSMLIWSECRSIGIRCPWLSTAVQAQSAGRWWHELFNLTWQFKCWWYECSGSYR